MAKGTVTALSPGDASARAADYEGKITFRLLVGVIVAATGGMLFGYDLGVTGEASLLPCIQLRCTTNVHLQHFQQKLLTGKSRALCAEETHQMHGCTAGGVSSFPDFINKFFPEILGQKGSNAYCTYNSQKLQMFTSSYFLAGKQCIAVTSCSPQILMHVSVCWCC